VKTAKAAMEAAAAETAKAAAPETATTTMESAKTAAERDRVLGPDHKADHRDAGQHSCQLLPTY
jgi:hypothetical protein